MPAPNTRTSALSSAIGAPKVECRVAALAAYTEASCCGMATQTGLPREMALARQPNSGNMDRYSCRYCRNEQRATAENVNTCRYVKPCLQRPLSQSSLL